ncbi:MAG: glycosyltransferase [Planctomycetes bacterium]|nr:glycosyltransferase [Planctomycetota bacterium]
MEIAIIIPAYNEEQTIGKVIFDLRKNIPTAKIHVCDNNSTDKTAEIAKSLQAIVLKEKRQGKGYAIQSMFSKIEADVYVMVDADDTYDLSLVNDMIFMVANDECDMIVGNRLKDHSDKSFRPMHILGNKLVTYLINVLFKSAVTDVMSGLRVMNRSFVKNINVAASGFEVETEMTIKALKYNYVLKEVNVKYKARPAGSVSKLNTVKDGFLVIRAIFTIFKDYKPFLFFSAVSITLFLISLLSGAVVIKEFIETHYITHVPLAIFASATMILAIIAFTTGVILDSANRRFDEIYNFIRNKK